MALKPLGDRIIVRFEETEEKTASGFVLAGASHETTKTAEVLAVGEGTRTLTGELIAPSVAVGDKVLVENGTGKNLIYKEILEGLSEQEKFPIISRSSLSKAEQIGAAITAGVSVENIKASISTTGLRIQTNALSTSQLGATITSSNLKLAIKGLGTEIKGLVSDVSIFLKAHPGLTSMAVTLALIAASIKVVNAFQDWADGTTAVNKYNESLEKSEQTISDNEKSISDYNSEIETNKKKIEELQELQSNGTITNAQKTEIENLKYQNALLDEKIEKLKQANDEELKA